MSHTCIHVPLEKDFIHFGGLLTGKYHYEDKDGSQPAGRFFGNSWAGAYRDRVILEMESLFACQAWSSFSKVWLLAEEGPLDQRVVDAFKETWNLIAHECPDYFR